MRIVQLIDTLDPDHGGPPLVVASLASAQAALGHEVTVLSYKTPGRDAAIKTMLDKVPGIERVRVEYMPPRDRLEPILGSIAKRHLPALIGECDVVHLHGVWETVLRVAARIARHAGKPYVIRPCGVLDPYSLRQKWLKKRAAMWLGCRAMLNGAAFLHALNIDESRLIEPLRLRCPVRVIPNGVFPDEFAHLPAKGTFRASPHAAGIGARPFILFLSRLHHKKGLDYLADAFALVAQAAPEARLVMVGPDDGAREGFVAHIARLGLTNRVILTGPLYGSQKLAAMVDANCFCLPSRQEGFSVAITEAMACGTPVVISTECHFPEVAEAGAGEALPLNAARFGEAIMRLLRDPSRARAMGIAGRNLILSRYVWPEIAKHTIEHYNAALPDTSTRGGA